MDQRRTLLVLRHVQTEDTRPGSPDSERRLTPMANATRSRWATTCAAKASRSTRSCCSSAARARQTLELLKLGDPPAPDRVEIADRFLQRRRRCVDERRP